MDVDGEGGSYVQIKFNGSSPAAMVEEAAELCLETWDYQIIIQGCHESMISVKY